MNLITQAIEAAGSRTALAKKISEILSTPEHEVTVSAPAVRKWQDKRGLPRTEWTGETRYGYAIEIITKGAITARALCPGANQYIKQSSEDA